MQIKECKFKTKCDIGGCKNLSKYSVENDDGKTVLNICEKCSVEIFNALASNKIPKGIDAPFKNPKKIKMEAK